MTNGDAILRLANNAHDVTARKALYDNNTAVIDASIEEFFGMGDSRLKARHQLLLRLADRCRLFPRGEDADLWIENVIEVETARVYKAVVSEAARVHAQAARV